MRTPPDPPPYLHVDPSELNTPDLRELVRRCNAKYRHWEKVRFYARDAGIDPLKAWAAVKLSRIERDDLPITLEHGLKLNYLTLPRHTGTLHQIDQMAGGSIETNSPLGFKHDRERYLINSLMEEAIASSQLEGAATTREVAKRMLRQKRKPRNHAERMILNNYRAIIRIRELVPHELTPSLICEIQQTITRDTLEDPTASGRFRTKGETVVVEDVETREVIHRPPAASSIDGRIVELCRFVNDVQEPFVHPVIKAIAVHFAIGFIHPFVDGNGRTARALFYWYMLKHKYWLFEFLPISRIFKESPLRYSRAYLFTEIDEGDLTYFIDYNLDVVRRAIDSLYEYLEKQQEELHSVSVFLSQNTHLNHRQQHVIRECVKNSSAIFSIKEHESTHNVSNGTARTDLLTLVKDSVLQKSKQGNRWIFSPVPNLTKKLIKTSGDKVIQQGSEQLVEFVESETPLPPPPPQDINISDANLS